MWLKNKRVFVFSFYKSHKYCVLDGARLLRGFHRQQLVDLVSAGVGMSVIVIRVCVAVPKQSKKTVNG